MEIILTWADCVWREVSVQEDVCEFQCVAEALDNAVNEAGVSMVFYSHNAPTQVGWLHSVQIELFCPLSIDGRAGLRSQLSSVP